MTLKYETEKLRQFLEEIYVPTGNALVCRVVADGVPGEPPIAGIRYKGPVKDMGWQNFWAPEIPDFWDDAKGAYTDMLRSNGVEVEWK